VVEPPIDPLLFLCRNHRLPESYGKGLNRAEGGRGLGVAALCMVIEVARNSETVGRGGSLCLPHILSLGYNGE